MPARPVFFLRRALFALAIFAILAGAIWSRPAKWMSDFDQSFYLTIAYDIDRHGVFSNGMFDDVNSVTAVPPPGMFMAPLYPWLVFAVTKVDARFARAVKCNVEANHKRRNPAECETYARPMNILHALLLAIGVVAVGRAAELIFRDAALFWLAGGLATLALVPDAELFSYVMTESLTFCMYSLTMLAMAAAWAEPQRVRLYALGGLLLGLLCLTRTSFLVLAPVLLALVYLRARFIGPVRLPAWPRLALFGLCFALVVTPWALRNYVSVGKLALTEEYGAAALIERFAFNTMTGREFALSVPYCLPTIGPPLVAAMAGPDAMNRFEWNKPGSFFETGRAERLKLLATYRKLDPVFGGIFRDEMSRNGWRHIASSLPLAWCGLWIGGWFAYLLVPGAAWAGVQAFRRAQPLYLLYACPALVMLALHAGVANHYTRYNLVLAGALAAGTGWLIAQSGWFRRLRSRWPARASAA